MSVYKRYKGKRLKPSDENWELGTWVVEFKLRRQHVKRPLPEAHTKAQAEQGRQAQGAPAARPLALG